jgi:hypothetical protein
MHGMHFYRIKDYFTLNDRASGGSTTIGRWPLTPLLGATMASIAARPYHDPLLCQPIGVIVAPTHRTRRRADPP